jgi:UDP-N-acetylmuramoyl-L-alanyl-D-glutamate--2,6-diaminopimelate ligase
MNAGGRGVVSGPVNPSIPGIALAAAAEACGGRVATGDPGARVRDIAFDPREVVTGTVFCCVPGAEADGHTFAPEAVSRGAAALLVERVLDLPVPQVVVSSVRAAMGPVAALLFGRPGDALTMVGVTGTNGKTTVTYLLESILRAVGLAPGVVGTTGARSDGAPVPIALTTPEAPDLHRLLRRMCDDGVRAVAMEVSSHALSQHRVDGLRFDAAVFTNLSQDHLDYHGSMERYFEAKARLFTPDLAACGTVNADDPWGRRLLADAAIPLTSFALDTDADLRGDGVRADVHGLTLLVAGVEVRSPLRGAFNAANVVAALSAARSLGIDLAAAAEGIAAMPGVPGRMEPVISGGGAEFLVVVDYAHTPDSIRSVLRGARPLATGRLIVVFGCGGDRDRAKRPLMGRAATSDADLTVLTSDNPRNEDPRAIIDEIVPGARDGGGAFLVEPDRRTAIRAALVEAKAGDVVIVAGKGHETTQELAGLVVPFDDRDVVREELALMGGGAWR